MRRGTRAVGAAVLAAVSLLLPAGPTRAQAPPPDDFLTGGGFILLPDAYGNLVVHGNFGVAGGCKQGGAGHGLWGHLEYIDHGSSLAGGKMLNVHWTMITEYMTDPHDSNARFIFGTATTNSPTPSIPSMVNFVVRAADHGEPGKGVDQFDILLTGTPYTTFGTGSPSPPFHTLAGGNIILHQPSTTPVDCTVLIM